MHAQNSASASDLDIIKWDLKFGAQQLCIHVFHRKCKRCLPWQELLAWKPEVIQIKGYQVPSYQLMLAILVNKVHVYIG